MTAMETSTPSGGDLRLRLVLTCAAAAAVHLFVLIFCDVTYVPPLLEPVPTSQIYLLSAADANPAFACNVDLWLDLADPSRLIRPRSGLLATPEPLPSKPLPAEGERVDEPAPVPRDPDLFPTGPVDTRSALWLPLSPLLPPATVNLQGTVPRESVAEFDEALSRRLINAWKPPAVAARLLSETDPTIVRL
ncbi:MAG: hypothetical protein AB7T14_10375, partial [Candidatus Methylacidiphilaceae bacterium]